MALREDIQKRIERKQEENREFDSKIRENNVYIQALQDTLKLLPKDSSVANSAISVISPRPGSELAKARDVLREARAPMHIANLLKAMGRPNDKKNRLALAGSLSQYVRKKMVFNRPLPNTFGLLEFAAQNGHSAAQNEVTDETLEVEEEAESEQAETEEEDPF